MIYISRQQFTGKDEFWNTILDAVQSVLYEKIQHLTKSMDELFQKYEAYILHKCWLYNLILCF